MNGRGSMGGGRNVPVWLRAVVTALLVWWSTLRTNVTTATGRGALRWLRRPRHERRGTLPPVIVTPEGAIVPTVERVPIRSTKADAKRQALVWARKHWKDDTLTWGQARKRIRKLEGRMRNGQLGVGATAIVEALGDDA